MISGPTAAGRPRRSADWPSAAAARADCPVACAFHSRGWRRPPTPSRPHLGDVDVGRPRFPVWSQHHRRRPTPATPTACGRASAGQVAAPVRFAEQIEAMYAAGARVFVEVGPGPGAHRAGRQDPRRPPAHGRGLRRAGRARASAGSCWPWPSWPWPASPSTPSTLFDGRDAEAVDACRRARPGPVPARRQPGPHRRRRAGAGLAAGRRTSSRRSRWPPGRRRRRPGGDPQVLGGRVPARHAADRGGRARRRARRAGRARPRRPPSWSRRPSSTRRRRRGPRSVGAAGNGHHGNGVGGNGVGGNGLGTGGAGHGVDAPAPVAGPPVLTPEALLETVVAIVSERTGYPVEMLDPDLDLEAELSIDSIKRIEILGELAERVGLPGMDESGVDESVIEELALIKTLRGIVDWVEDHRDDEALLAAASGSSPAAAAAPAASPVLSPEALLETVVAIVSERTGYPVEMLDPDLDLEAELSIDSIKRIEILGELAERVGLPGMDESGVDESVIEELALIKTLRGIVDWVEDHKDLAPGGELPGDGSAGDIGPADGRVGSARPRRCPPRRRSGRGAARPRPARRRHRSSATCRRSSTCPRPARSRDLAGMSVVVVDDGSPVGDRLHDLLAERGATPRRAAPAQAADAVGAGVDTLVDLTALSVAVEPTAADLGSADVTAAVVAQFERLRAAAQAGAARVVVVTGQGGHLGHGGQVSGGLGPATVAAGVQGVIRTFARELAVVESRLVDVDPAAGADEVAHHLLGELRGRRPAHRGGAGRGGAPDAVDRRPAARRRRRDRGGDRRRPRPRSRLGRRRHRRRPRHRRPRGDRDGPHHRVRHRARRPVAAARPRAGRPGRGERRGGGAPGDHPARRAQPPGRDRGGHRPGRWPIGRSGRPWRRWPSAPPSSATARSTSATRPPSRPALDGDPPRARTARRRRPRRRGPRGQADPRQDARVVRPGVRHEGRLGPGHRRRRRRATGFALLFGSVSGWFGNAGQVDYAAANSALDGIARRARAAAPGSRVRGGRLGTVGRHRHGVARAGPRVRAARHRSHRPRRRGGRRPRRAAGGRPRRRRSWPCAPCPSRWPADRGVRADRRRRDGGDLPRRARPRHLLATTSSAASTPSATCRPTGSTRSSSSRGRTGPTASTAGGAGSSTRPCRSTRPTSASCPWPRRAPSPTSCWPSPPRRGRWPTPATSRACPIPAGSVSSSGGAAT